MGIGRIFPIWYVNEGRYRVRPSVRGGRSLSAGVYGEIPTAESSDASELASQFGRSRLCGAESQLCGGDVLGSLALPLRRRRRRLSVYLPI